VIGEWEGGRRPGISWVENERRRRGRDRERENKSGFRARDVGWSGEGEKGRTTSARSRATIGDRLSSSLVRGDLSGGGSRAKRKYDSFTAAAAAAAAAAAIIKLFTHTARYLSSERDHNVLLFDPHFVSDLSSTAMRTWQIAARSGVLLTISRRIARRIILRAAFAPKRGSTILDADHGLDGDARSIDRSEKPTVAVSHARGARLPSHV